VGNGQACGFFARIGFSCPQLDSAGPFLRQAPPGLIRGIPDGFVLRFSGSFSFHRRCPTWSRAPLFFPRNQRLPLTGGKFSPQPHVTRAFPILSKSFLGRLNQTVLLWQGQGSPFFQNRLSRPPTPWGVPEPAPCSWPRFGTATPFLGISLLLAAVFPPKSDDRLSYISALFWGHAAPPKKPPVGGRLFHFILSQTRAPACTSPTSDPTRVPHQGFTYSGSAQRTVDVFPPPARASYLLASCRTPTILIFLISVFPNTPLRGLTANRRPPHFYGPLSSSQPFHAKPFFSRRNTYPLCASRMDVDHVGFFPPPTPAPLWVFLGKTPCGTFNNQPHPFMVFLPIPFCRPHLLAPPRPGSFLRRFRRAALQLPKKKNQNIF